MSTPGLNFDVSLAFARFPFSTVFSPENRILSLVKMQNYSEIKKRKKLVNLHGSDFEKLPTSFHEIFFGIL